MDLHTLGLVDLLDFGYQILLGVSHAPVLQNLLGIQWPIGEGIAGQNRLSGVHPHPGMTGKGDFHLAGIAHLVGAGDPHPAASIGDQLHRAADGRQESLALGASGLEEFQHPGQALGDVGSRHATGVESPHGQLGARFSDRLGRHDSHRGPFLDHLAGGQAHAVAALAHGSVGIAGEHRAHLHPPYLRGLVDYDPQHLGIYQTARLQLVPPIGGQDLTSGLHRLGQDPFRRSGCADGEPEGRSR